MATQKSELATSYRTHTCGELRALHISAPPSEPLSAVLAGHVDRRVDGQSVLLRDRYGKTLVTAHGGAPPYVFERFEKLNLEDVVQVEGDVDLRAAPDPELETGEIVLRARRLEVLSPSTPGLPKGVLGDGEVAPDDRLAFRQLYLRRPDVKKRLALRMRIAGEIREFLLARGFLEIETPQLFWYDKVALRPEVVPAGGGKAFALPAGPVVLDQYWKPAAFDRTFQFTRITRREADPGPMHAQEHTGLDINMCYVDVADFCALVEEMVAHVFRAVLGQALERPFPELAYAEAMARYGTDQPDLREPGGMDVADLDIVAPEGVRARGFRVPGAGLEDAALDALAKGAPGGAQLLWVRVGSDHRLEGPAIGLFTEERFHSIPAREARLAPTGARPGDAVVVALAKDAEVAAALAGTARRALVRRLGLADGARHKPVWITKYPFLENDGGNLVPRVVVFARAIDEDRGLLGDRSARGRMRARAFDLVIDGVEVASAYIGNHDLEVQRLLWQDLYLLGTSDLVRLRAPIEAHRFGCPPHGGMNLGFDRLVAIMAGASSLDEVMFFPKSRECRDPLLGAPAPVAAESVAELTREFPKPKFTEADLALEVTKS